MSITRDDGITAPSSVTVTVGPLPTGVNVHQVLPGTSIQTAIKNAGPNDPILVAPGTYDELVVMYKPVRLQGAGAYSTFINARKVPGEKLQAWRDTVNTELSAGSFDLLPGQVPGFDPANNEPILLNDGEGAYITVLGKSSGPQRNRFRAANNARIDGLTITGADHLASRLEGDALLAYQLETGSVSVILEGDIREALLSPDGAWLVVHCSRALGEPPGHWVMPSRFTQQMRQLEIGTNTTGFAWRSLRPLAMLDTLRLGNLTIPLDGFGVPEAVALDGAGRRLALPASSLRWSLEDTSIVVIDPGSGRITPLRQGTTRMTVTAGGWRSAAGALTVTPPKTRTVLADSTWDDLDPSPR